MPGVACQDAMRRFPKQLGKDGGQAGYINWGRQRDGPPAPVTGRVFQEGLIVRRTNEAHGAGEVLGIAPELFAEVILLGGYERLDALDFRFSHARQFAQFGNDDAAYLNLCFRQIAQVDGVGKRIQQNRVGDGLRRCTLLPALRAAQHENIVSLTTGQQGAGGDAFQPLLANLRQIFPVPVTGGGVHIIHQPGVQAGLTVPLRG